MAAVQVSENWDDDFEFQVEKRKMSTATAKSEATEIWDDDFEDSRQSPKKIIQRHREESWDDDEDDNDENNQFGLFAEEDRTVTARSRRAALARLSIPGHLPHSPTSSVFSVPTTIHTYSSTAHLRPTSAFALISPPIHKERERRRLRKKSRPKPQAVFELSEIPSQERSSFSDVDLPRPASALDSRGTSRSDLSIHERPPLVASALAETSIETSEWIGPPNGPVSIPHTPTKAATLLSRIGSVKKWGVRRKRGDSTAPTDAHDSFIEREPIPKVTSKWDLRRRMRGDSTTPADTIPTGSRSQTDEDTTQSQSQSTSHLPTPRRARRRGKSITTTDVISNDLWNDHRLTPRASSSLSSYQQQHPLPPLPTVLFPSLNDEASHPTHGVLEKEKGHQKEKGKEGTRSFMPVGSVRRISLISVGVLGRQPPSPPSPPRTTTTGHIQSRSRAYTTNEVIEGLELETLLVTPSTSSSYELPLPPLPPSKLSPGKSPLQSQQSVSLGRSANVNVAGGGDEATGLSLASGSGNGGGGVLPRRNSLGDLKIPARISQAQVGLRRDLGLVREFASNVEQLKELQNTYNTLVFEVRALLFTHVHQRQRVQLPPPPQPVEKSLPPASSLNFFTQLKLRPKIRARSDTVGSTTPHSADVDSDVAVTASHLAYNRFVEAFWSINYKYRVSWECAELLIELGSGSGGGDDDGGGVTSAPPSAATTSVSAPAIQQHLAGASTGRHDLCQRQLVLLREMLNNNSGANIVGASDNEGGLSPPSHFPIPTEEDLELRPSTASLYPSPYSQYVNRGWRWGDARNSTITFSEDQESGCGAEGGRRDRKMEKEKERRGAKLGMSAIRDMLRSLKKGRIEELQNGSMNPGEGQSTQQCNHHRHGRLPTAVALAQPMMHSTTSLSTESSIGSKSVYDRAQVHQQQNRLPISRIPSQIQRRGRSSTGPESMKSNKGPTSLNPPFSTAPKPSPRRPSLASIFRIGNNKTRPAVLHTGVGVVDSAFSASEHDFSAVQCSNGTTVTGGEYSNSTGEEEEDWDRMNSPSDIDTAAIMALGIVDGPYDVSATVRGRGKVKTKADAKRTGVSPYLQNQSLYESDQHHPPPLPASSSLTALGNFLTRHSIIPMRSFSASQSSILGSAGSDGQQHSTNVPSCLSRHSNFKEQCFTDPADNVLPTSFRVSSSKSAPTTSQSKSPSVNLSASSTPRSSSRPSSSRSTKFPNAKTGSVRSMLPHLVPSSLVPGGLQGQQLSPLSSLPDPRLEMIMTPENIKPLLENAKEVHMKLNECIVEIRALIDNGAAAIGHTGVVQAPPT